MIMRDLWKEIEKFADAPEIIAIRGPRQAGKTTLMKFIKEKVEGDVVFLNLDQPSHRDAIKRPLDLVRRYKKGRRLVLFLDEIQRVENAGEYLKILYDEFEDVKIFVSGSSSLEMRTRVLPLLVGRLLLFDLYTFNFHEFLLSKDKGLARVFEEKRKSIQGAIAGNDEPEEESFSEEFRKHLEEYVVFGGYPRVVLEEDAEKKRILLRNLVDLYIEKDIVSFFGVSNTEKFEAVARYLSFYSTYLLNLSDLAKSVGISRHVAEEYVSMLSATYVVKLVPPFYSKMSVELRRQKKIFFLDTGMRNAVIGNFADFPFRDDKGKLLENFIFREFASSFRGWQIKYWRTTSKAEIDFILEKDGKIVPVEVKAGQPKVTRGFRSFIKTYQPETAFVACLSGFGHQQIEGTKVYFVPAWHF